MVVRWRHLKRLPQARSTVWFMDGIPLVLGRTKRPHRLRGSRNSTHIHCRVVGQVFVPCNQYISMDILEANTMTIIYTVEVFHGGYDRFCTIMWIDQNSQRYARSSLGAFVKQEL